MKNTIFFACKLMIIFSSLILGCSARNTISLNRPLIDGETLISPSQIFVLGFFTPDGRSDHNRYVGIWYYNLSPLTVVWVANRENPVLSTGGNLTVENGNLKIFEKSVKIWSTDLETESHPRLKVTWEATLMDSGNLVLRNDSGGIIWESFKDPTDTFLLGMEIDQNLTLTSWKSQADPSQGNFTFKLDKDKKDQFIVMSGIIPYWKSGVSGSSDGVHVPYLINSSRGLDDASNYNYTRLTLNFEGKIQYLKWNVYQDLNLGSPPNNWQVQWSEPKDNCSIYKYCGNFGSCDINNKILCKCLPGFRPQYPDNWEKGIFSDGCIRNSTTCGSGEDIFLSLKMMKVEDTETFTVQNEKECRDKCLEKCQCLAYSYSEVKNKLRGMEPTCSIWIDHLINLQEEFSDGKNLFVRVSKSDVETTTRTCEACGTNAIPYPLSTGFNCGDPSYLSFYCNNSTSKLSFEASGGRYNITSVNPSTRTFFIQAKASDVCDITNRAALHVNRPFNMTNISSCGADAESGVSEVQISWEPPLEPRCNTTADCKDWPNTNCNLANGTRRCFCNAKFQWDGIALNCTSEENQPEQFGSSPAKKRPLVFIIGPIIAGVIIISCAAPYIFLFIRRRILAKKQERRGSGEGNTTILYSTEKRVKDLMNTEDFTEEEKKRIDVPFFSLESILAATNNFSDSNKLGRGGFGPVYKGIFPGGQEIAIKRLSKLSKQGLEEFKNEIVLIARLQHRNLVRLLGYCIQGEEKILLYEFMPNKSLDLFMFDENLRTLLNWEKRFDIILGTARGLLYLHQDSRLRIIHRDMKTSNILLDAEMNPKISDFGMARIFEAKQIEGATNRVVGTYGYMSPEYALDGLFSVKSDVYSFGVVILEIVSGRRNTGVFKIGQALNLLSIAWRLWSEDKAMEFMDETLRESCKSNEFLKCFHIALLCVQQVPADRPTMSDVVVMLSSNETSTFPIPKTSAFVERAEHSDIVSFSSSSIQEISSDFMSNIGGR